MEREQCCRTRALAPSVVQPLSTRPCCPLRPFPSAKTRRTAPGEWGGGPCSRALKEAGDFRVGDGVKRREQCVQTDAQLILRVCVRMVGGAGTAAGRASGVEELFRGGQPRKLRAKPGWMSP